MVPTCVNSVVDFIDVHLQQGHQKQKPHSWHIVANADKSLSRCENVKEEGLVKPFQQIVQTPQNPL